MGNVMRRTTRIARRYNVENRAAKELDREKPKMAPRHESTTKRIEQFASENPELLEEQKKKNLDLHERLKQIRIESEGTLPEMKARPKPKNKSRSELSGYSSFIDPKKVSSGHVSLTKALEILIMDQQMVGSSQKTAKNMAKEHNLKLEHVQNLLKHFKTLEMLFPKRIIEDNPTLASELRRIGSKQFTDPVGGYKENIDILKEKQEKMKGKK